MMKKIIVLLVISLMVQFAIAQVKTNTDKAFSKNGSGTEHKRHHKMGRHDKREIMKQLNLSAEQKAKLKELNGANKEKRQAIMNDSKLTEDQKHEQLKAMHKGEVKNLEAVLTEEQKQQMKELKEKKNVDKKEHKGKKNKKAEDEMKEPENKTGTQNK